MYSNGDIYNGDWLEDQRHGHGELYFFKTQQKYIGQFVWNKRQGKGKEVFPGGEQFEGEFYENLRMGKGRLTFPNGSVLNSEFKDNLANGSGNINYANGNKYQGEFRQGRRNGKGYCNKAYSILKTETIMMASGKITRSMDSVTKP
jgi:hypothetical protein